MARRRRGRRRRRAARAAARRRRAGREPAADPRPLPGAARASGCARRSSSVRPYMESHGGNVELLGAARTASRGCACEGSCDGCSASASTLELAIKQALEEAAPDLDGLEVEGVEPAGAPTAAIAAAGVERRRGGARPGSTSTGVDRARAGELGDGRGRRRARSWWPTSSGTLLAYRDRCAGCGEPLHDGELDRRRPALPRLRAAYFLPRAGRSMDDERLQLEPVPLLRDRGAVRVALARERERRRAGRRPRSGAAEAVAAAAARRWSPARATGPAGAAAPPVARTTASAATCAAPTVPDDHRHLLQLVERRIVCACESCWAMRSGDPEYRPTGSRTLWLADFDLPDDLWASFQIPIGLAFFMARPRPAASSPCTRARPAPPRASCTSRRGPDGRAEPGARRPRARRRGADRQPAVRPAGLRDRADRPLLRARRARSRRAGRASPAARAVEEAVAGVLRASCAPRRPARHERRAADADRPPASPRARRSGARVRGARRAAGALRGGARP